MAKATCLYCKGQPMSALVRSRWQCGSCYTVFVERLPGVFQIEGTSTPPLLFSSELRKHYDRIAPQVVRKTKKGGA